MGAAWVLAIAFLWVARPTRLSLLTGGAFILLGLAARAWAAGVLEKDRELAISGPYAHTRNPLYLGSLVIGAGAVVAGGVPWFGLPFLAFFAWLYGSAMTTEARALANRFGPAYHHYRDSVPVLLPRPARYRPPPGIDLRTRSFSLRRYLRNREYEALLGALFALGLLSLKASGVLPLAPPP